MEQNEPELIAHILNGDEALYEQLINRYKQGLYRHCFRLVHDEDLAEDIAQEAFIEAYVHLDRYNPQFRFSTWLYKIATNNATSKLRRKTTVRFDDDELDRIIGTLPDSETLAMHKELHDAVDALPLKYRTVVSMHYWHGKSYAEIATEMGSTVGSVKGWMSRAKHYLKETLS